MQLLRTSSLSNLKKKAKKLKKANGCSMMEAYNTISKEYGFNSWKELLKTLKIESDNQGIIFEGDYKNQNHAAQITSLALSIAQEEYPYISNLSKLYPSQQRFYKSQASTKFAQSLGYCTYGDYLKENFTTREKYTFSQKLSYICKPLNIDPRKINNTIHVFMDHSYHLLYEVYGDELDKKLEKLGLIKDLDFMFKVINYDPYFDDDISDGYFRLVSFDSKSYSKIYNFIKSTLSQLDDFESPEADCIWINGFLDPSFIADITAECLIDKTDIKPASGNVPIHSLPEKIWKGVY